MTEFHGPGEWSGWATIATGVTIVLGGLASAVLWIRSRIRKALNVWRTGDEALERKIKATDQRVTELSVNVMREVDAIALEARTRDDVHEQKDEARFARIHERLDQVGREMARREDIIVVQGTVNQILLLLSAKPS